MNGSLPGLVPLEGIVCPEPGTLIIRVQDGANDEDAVDSGRPVTYRLEQVER